MSASSAFGGQSSRSPQARAPITIPRFLSSLLPHFVSSCLSLGVAFFPFESGSDRNVLLLFAFVPLYFALSLSSFIDRSPLLSLISFFLLSFVSSRLESTFFFFFGFCFWMFESFDSFDFYSYLLNTRFSIENFII